MREEDPLQEAEAASGETDLYGIATWEPRTALDRLSIGVYRGALGVARWLVILTALAILLAQFALTGLATIANPMIGVFTLLSVLPALGFAVYLWVADVTMREPLGTLVTTYLLGILLASFAALLNSLAQPWFAAIPLVGMVLFFYLVVAPVEETVKWLAIRLYAFRSRDFDAVVDGAIYGAAAGLGFATIENALYIGRLYVSAIQSGAVPGAVFGATLQITALRTFAGPGHVIYSGFAGYYLGLAKFNPENAGPIAVKGLLIAAFLHATYNAIVSNIALVPALLGVSVSPAVAFLGFVVVYDGVFGYALYRKIAAYRAAYHESRA